MTGSLSQSPWKDTVPTTVASSPIPASALEGLLSPSDEDSPAALRRRLRDARGLEEAIELTSRAVKEEEFAISVATMGTLARTGAASSPREWFEV